MIAPPSAQPIRERGLFWMFVPLGLLVISVSGWLYMVTIAVDDPGFAVETDYYKKASKYDEVIAQESENARLGWIAEPLGFAWLPNGDARLTVRVRGREENLPESLTLRAEAFPVTRSTRIQTLQFAQHAAGVFTAIVVRPREGLWEVRVTLQSASGEKATALLRPELLTLTGAKHGEVTRE